MAAVAAERGEPERAARLFGAAEAQRETLGSARPPADQPGYDAGVASARGMLDAEAFAAAWAEGSALTLEQAIDAALNEV
jgi:hypothetical protein